MVCEKKDCCRPMAAHATYRMLHDGRLSRAKNRFLCEMHADEFCRFNELNPWPSGGLMDEGSGPPTSENGV